MTLRVTPTPRSLAGGMNSVTGSRLWTWTSVAVVAIDVGRL
jgi:hypothetical protein